MGAMRRATFLAVLMMISGLAGCFGAEEDENTGEIVAVFTYSPATNIRVGQTIDFDARDSLPSGVALTYKWDFDGDQSIDATGRTADWTYTEARDYTVELIVSDGTKSQSTTKTLTIVDASAVPPTAEITSYSSEEDCEGEDVDEGNYIHIWLCDLEKSMSSRSAEGELDVELDASDSSSGSSGDYISKYYWDLDLEFDADGDGDATNDNDLEGETVEWKDVKPGEYEIGLTITNGKGLTDSDDIKVHVSYGASWLDFPVGRASASQGGSTPTSIDFDFDVNYEDNGGGTNTVRKVVGKLMYPAQDSPCFAGDCQGRLDLEAHNQDDEGPSSTAPAENSGYDSRDSNCDNEKHCVELTLSSYIFTDSEADSTYGDGPWTMNVLNNETYDQQVDRFMLLLIYK